MDAGFLFDSKLESHSNHIFTSFCTDYLQPQNGILSSIQVRTKQVVVVALSCINQDISPRSEFLNASTTSQVTSRCGELR